MSSDDDSSCSSHSHDYDSDSGVSSGSDRSCIIDSDDDDSKSEKSEHSAQFDTTGWDSDESSASGGDAVDQDDVQDDERSEQNEENLEDPVDDAEDDEEAPIKPPKGRSIAHHHLRDGTVVYLSFDIEIGGIIAGIIQLSGELVRITIVPSAKGVAGDTATEVERIPITFNSYVKPWTDVWDQNCIDVHQIHPTDERITSADSIDHVWQQFSAWLSRNIRRTDTVILVAWNGQSCDLKWLWTLTQAPGSRLSFPNQIKYFLDPSKVIAHFKSCALNKSKSKVGGYDVASMYKFVNGGRNLNGAQTALLMSRPRLTSLLARNSSHSSIGLCLSNILATSSLLRNRMTSGGNLSQCARFIIHGLSQLMLIGNPAHVIRIPAITLAPVLVQRII